MPFVCSCWKKGGGRMTNQGCWSIPDKNVFLGSSIVPLRRILYFVLKSNQWFYQKPQNPFWWYWVCCNDDGKEHVESTLKMSLIIIITFGMCLRIIFKSYFYTKWWFESKEQSSEGVQLHHLSHSQSQSQSNICSRCIALNADKLVWFVSLFSTMCFQCVHKLLAREQAQ